MARAHVVLVASFLAAALSRALAVSPQPDAAALQASLVRRDSRHSKEDNTFSLSPRSTQYQRTHDIKQHHQSDTGCNLISSINQCNCDWPLATTSDRNSCSSGGVEITNPATCQLAAEKLGYSYNGSYDWSWIVVNSSTVLVPENCFVENGIVHHNPAASNTQAADANGVIHYKGVKICTREKYMDGTEGVNSVPSACTVSDYEPIDGATSGDYTSCREATVCMVGVDGCQMQAFEDNGTISLNDRPHGCFRNNGVADNGVSMNGCFGYNAQVPTENPIIGRTDRKSVV